MAAGRFDLGTAFTHLILAAAVLVLAFPLYLTIVGASYDAPTIANGQMPLWPGPHLFGAIRRTLFTGSATDKTYLPVGQMLLNSFVMALGIASGKIAISLLSAFAIAFFRFPLRKAAFWLVFLTLMLPVEVRIYPTYKVVSDLQMLDSFWGLTIPLMASATATLFYRQAFLTVPDEIVEAAKLDGAGPLTFLRHILIPLSRTSTAALFVILFIYGWNQYLWPLLITTRDDMQTIVVGIRRMIVTADALTDWPAVMATTLLATLPPVAVVVLMQRWFVKGLVETEK